MGFRRRVEDGLDGEYLPDHRVVQDGFHRAGGGDAAVSQRNEVVGVGEDEVEIVKDGEDGDILGHRQFAGEAEDLVLMGQVEARGGLVEQQQAARGPPSAGGGLELHEGAGEVDALFFASGKGRIKAVGEGGEPNAAERGPGERTIRAAVAATRMRYAAQAHHFLHAEGKAQVAFLREHRTVAGERGGGPGRERAIEEGDGTGLRCQFAGEYTEEGAFARAVGADDCGDTPGGEAERNIVEDAAVAAEDDEAGGGEKRRHG